MIKWQKENNIGKNNMRTTATKGYVTVNLDNYLCYE